MKLFTYFSITGSPKQYYYAICLDRVVNGSENYVGFHFSNGSLSYISNNIPNVREEFIEEEIEDCPPFEYKKMFMFIFEADWQR